MPPRDGLAGSFASPAFRYAAGPSCALVGEARAGGPSREAQGRGVVGDKGPIQVRYVDRDGGAALPRRGPVHYAPEEGGLVFWRIARLVARRLVYDAGEGERPLGISLLGALPYRDLQGDFVESPRASLEGRCRDPEAMRPRGGERLAQPEGPAFLRAEHQVVAKVEESGGEPEA